MTLTKDKPQASQVDLFPEVFLGLISPRAVESMVFAGALASSGKSASWLAFQEWMMEDPHQMNWNQEMR